MERCKVAGEYTVSRGRGRWKIHGVSVTVELQFRHLLICMREGRPSKLAISLLSRYITRATLAHTCFAVCSSRESLFRRAEYPPRLFSSTQTLLNTLRARPLFSRHSPERTRSFQRFVCLIMAARKKSVGDLKEADLKGKRVFVRVDLNVPLDENLNITDDTRVRAAVPTIKYLMGNGAKVILSSHLRSVVHRLHLVVRGLGF
ncbi:hypothetical protein ACLOJK_020073 [Asimina triloba]